MQALHPYAVFAGDAEHGVCLVFHFTARKAKALAWKEKAEVVDLSDFTDVHAMRLRGAAEEWAKGDADPELMARQEPHVVEGCPAGRYCGQCGNWLTPLTDGLCAPCAAG